jgi:hypothetical protein
MQQPQWKKKTKAPSAVSKEGSRIFQFVSNSLAGPLIPSELGLLTNISALAIQGSADLQRSPPDALAEPMLLTSLRLPNLSLAGFHKMGALTGLLCTEHAIAQPAHQPVGEGPAWAACLKNNQPEQFTDQSKKEIAWENCRICLPVLWKIWDANWAGGARERDFIS